MCCFFAGVVYFHSIGQVLWFCGQSVTKCDFFLTLLYMTGGAGYCFVTLTFGIYSKKLIYGLTTLFTTAQSLTTYTQYNNVCQICSGCSAVYKSDHL